MTYIENILRNEKIESVRKKTVEEIFVFFVKTEGDDSVVVGSKHLSTGDKDSAGISDGVFNQTIDACRELKADGLVLLHNHPKNFFNLVLKPSEKDLDFTVAFYCLAKGHKIKLVDHLIVDYDKGYYSFKENDLI